MDNKLLTELNNILKDQECYEQVKSLLAELIKSDQPIQQRKEQFKVALVKYLSTYGKDMLNDFYSYWSECNRAPKPKMRWELEKTWELNKRLARWARNSHIQQDNEPNLNNY